MILPDKYVSLSESFIGLSALVLDVIKDKHLTIDILWEKFENKYIKKKKLSNPPTFQKFIYVLEFMFLTDMISQTEKGEIKRADQKTDN